MKPEDSDTHTIASGEKLILRDGLPSDADAYAQWMTRGEWLRRSSSGKAIGLTESDLECFAGSGNRKERLRRRLQRCASGSTELAEVSCRSPSEIGRRKIEMRARIEPRRIAGWEFFNENVGVCDVVRPGGVDALSADDRKVAERFIEVLRGKQKVLDVGCGSGFPGLYVAPHVGEIVGVDAAPNMIRAAGENALKLGVNNASFEVGGADGLPFASGEFDGALLCGLLESTDWPGAHRMMAEVGRGMAPGGRLAVLDQDWRDVLERKRLNETSVRRREDRLIVRFVQRSLSPAGERDTRYLVNPESPLGRRLLGALGDKASVPVTIDPRDLDPNAVLDTWYDEAAQFDAETLGRLVASQGFRQSKMDVLPVWGQKALFLTAIK